MNWQATSDENFTFFFGDFDFFDFDDFFDLLVDKAEPEDFFLPLLLEPLIEGSAVPSGILKA